jgi:peroxiredoxin
MPLIVEQPGEVPALASEAPDFELGTAQGGRKRLSEAQGPVFLWFAPGLVCPFCRQNMAHAKAMLAELRARDADIWLVTPTAERHAAFYARRYDLAFPYLCDERYEVHARYGLGPAAGITRILRTGFENIPGAVGGLLNGTQPNPMPYLARHSPGELARDQAVLLVSRRRRVRWVHVIGPHSPLPANAAWLQALGSAEEGQEQTGLL